MVEPVLGLAVVFVVARHVDDRDERRHLGEPRGNSAVGDVRGLVRPTAAVAEGS